VSLTGVEPYADVHREAYTYILRCLATFPAEQVSSPEARQYSLRALCAAFVSPTHFDFHDLTSLPTIQALAESDPIYTELLEVMSEKELDDYNDFYEEHHDFVDEAGLDPQVLHRKMRLMTLASVAASTPTRRLEYARIARALQIPAEEVEMWVIDVIRAGLVEGKLSQQQQLFLVHRTTYRVFGDKQWREVATRLDTWKASLRGVLAVVRRERQAVEKAKELELQEADRRATGAHGMGAGRRPLGTGLVSMGTD
jgi:translation initiation factor 3 subunit M